MLPIAGQTAGPIGLIFLWTLRGGRGVLLVIKIQKFFKTFFYGQRRALHLVINTGAEF